jgi:hypothetical protein
VHMLYEEVKVKIRTSANIFESFRSDIGVKQGWKKLWITNTSELTSTKI